MRGDRSIVGGSILRGAEGKSQLENSYSSKIIYFSMLIAGGNIVFGSTHGAVPGVFLGISDILISPFGYGDEQECKRLLRCVDGGGYEV
jgi:hypothetical protein